MKLEDFFKTTEAIVVLLGLFLTVVLGKFWAFATAITYILLNVPSLWKWLKDKFEGF
ncbi:hypothetical protein [Changchengzhania lutea]|uniref:hypothetical protein n=1 Tax=Changchengzhania lutea TaxID=2049305 RepID=UPI00163DDC94|nr:hypothetical protein [Changchengzhania lutea]